MQIFISTSRNLPHFDRQKMLIKHLAASLRCFSQQQITQTASKTVLSRCPAYMQLAPDFESNEPLAQSFIESMLIVEDFLSEAEEKSILDEVEPYMRKLHYEFDHWDNAIHGYRETERLQWNEANTKILERVRSFAFPVGVSALKFVHILDLDAKGYIKPHIDAVRFCGDTIAGLSLLTDSVMRLVHEKQNTLFGDVLLKRRSLYVMKGSARYDYKHEILKNEESYFKGAKVEKNRRISVICRNAPKRD